MHRVEEIRARYVLNKPYSVDSRYTEQVCSWLRGCIHLRFLISMTKREVDQQCKVEQGFSKFDL